MTQLTIRGLSEEIAQVIRDLAKKEGVSLNQAVLRLIQKGAGLDPKPTDDGRINHALDTFFGGWSDSDAKDFEQSTTSMNNIDDDFWS